MRLEVFQHRIGSWTWTVTGHDGTVARGHDHPDYTDAADEADKAMREKIAVARCAFDHERRRIAAIAFAGLSAAAHRALARESRVIDTAALRELAEAFTAGMLDVGSVPGSRFTSNAELAQFLADRIAPRPECPVN